MKKRMEAEVIDRRGRLARIKFQDGVIGNIPSDISPGTKIIITIENDVCSFDPNRIWPTSKTAV